MRVVSRITDERMGAEDVQEYPFASHVRANLFIERQSGWLKSVGYSRYKKDGKTVFVAPDRLTIEYEIVP